MEQYIKPVEAVKLTDENIESVVEWMNGLGELKKDYKGRYILLNVLNEYGPSGIGDWIIKDLNGNFNSVTDYDFTKLYRPSPAKAEQEGPWVKASDRLPDISDGVTKLKIDGKEAEGVWSATERAFIVGGHRYPPTLYCIEWLCESTPPVKEVAYDELWDEFSEYIDDDIDSLSTFAGRTVLTKAQYIKLVAKLKAAPVKEAGQPADDKTFDENLAYEIIARFVANSGKKDSIKKIRKEAFVDGALWAKKYLESRQQPAGDPHAPDLSVKCSTTGEPVETCRCGSDHK